MMKYTFYIYLLLLVCFSCKTNKNKTTEGIALKDKISFLDSIAASKAIVEAEVDGLFQYISEADVSVQMKNTDGYQDRETAKNDYIQFIRTEVESFTVDDQEFVKQVVQRAYNLIEDLNVELVPEKLRFIKIKTNHYGKDVYYTRGNIILLPANIFKYKNVEETVPVMIHEIWHVLSRYNSDLREKSYAEIGFKRHGKEVKLSSDLAKKLLVNPDGVKMDYGITLGGQTAIPIITSLYPRFIKVKPRFFDYLKFDLYLLDEEGNIVTDAAGQTTLPMKDNQDFFDQIKNNTQYIIHPDEIIADNFMLGILALRDDDFDKFSQEGRELLDSLIEIWKSEKSKI